MNDLERDARDAVREMAEMQEQEDREDIAAAREALREPGESIPLEVLRAELKKNRK